jgi:hypothetical protein
MSDREVRVSKVAEILRDAIFRRGQNWLQAADEVLDAVDAEAEYEYGIQTFDRKSEKWFVIGEWFGYGTLDFFTTIEDREGYIDDLRMDYVDPTFMLVRRRKAGPVEIV